MPDSVRNDAEQLLSGVLPRQQLETYLKLLAIGAVPKAEADSFLGGSEMVRDLIDHGLAHPAPHTPSTPATIQATVPELAVFAVLANLKDAAMRDHQMLMDAYARLGEYQARQRGQGGFVPDRQVRVIRDRVEIMNLSLTLINGSSEWMSLERFSADMPVTEDYTVAPPQVLQGKMRCRAIYDRASVEHPVISKNMRRAAQAGEQARFLETVPTKMQITDSALLLPLTDSGTGGAVFIQDAPVVAGMQWMYEMAWDRAIPIGGSVPPDCPLNKVQRDVLRLLAQDTPEKKIERLLDISESTVYRSTNKIMEALGVETKFAAGAAAQRRGWIEPHEERHA
jgi:DNA-binding CsgD family transcriptional regulator